MYFTAGVSVALESFLFSPPKEIAPLSKKAIISTILSFRMEGGSSLQAISTMMRRIGLEKYSSIGYISKILSRIRGLLPSIVQVTETKPLVIANDEIFSKSQPILINVDPISSVVITSFHHTISKIKIIYFIIKNNL